MMTKFSRVLISTLLIAFIGVACSKPAANSVAESTPSPAAQKITSEGVVKVVALPVRIPASGSAEATVRLTIQSGYHVNANPPTFPYLKATVLEIPPAEGVSAGAITYPKGLERKFVFAEKPLAVYEGEIDMRVMLKADKEAKKSERSIPGHLRIQACDEQVCYPPGKLELTIPVSVD